MKLMTLNTHSLVEKDYEAKLEIFVSAVEREMPDVIALQEVNQSLSAPEVRHPAYFLSAKEDTVLREDNHALRVSSLLWERGLHYYFSWLPVKIGYGKYNEGLAMLSRSTMIGADSLCVSRTREETDWKKRSILGIRCSAFPHLRFYSVHYGWWNDSIEPFLGQWQKTCTYLSDKGRVWLMGDFNSPARVRGEGYDAITACGWRDSYTMAEKKDGGVTVKRIIDGWRDAPTEGMRIDQIWCNYHTRIKESRVVLDGKQYGAVSDHFGVIVQTEDEPVQKNGRGD